MDRRETLSRIESKLRLAEYNEAERKMHNEDLAFALQSQEAITRVIRQTKQVQQDLKAQITGYRLERLKLLELQVQNNLGACFANRNFRVRMVPSTYYGKDTIELLVGEGARMAPTEMQNGRFLRQVVNFSMTTMIQIMSGCKLLLLDEATNSGDDESIENISMLLKELIDKGYQVIITEHKHGAYKNLPRLQYNLALTTDKKVEVISKHVYN